MMVSVVVALLSWVVMRGRGRAECSEIKYSVVVRDFIYAFLFCARDGVHGGCLVVG